MRALATRSIVPRIADIEAFARETLVLLLRHEATQVEFDRRWRGPRSSSKALDARTNARFGSASAPMARAEDLVIFKALAARPTDIQDATTLLALHAEIDLARVRRRVGELAVLAEEPALVDGLEAMIAAARPKRRKPVSDADRP